MATSADRDHFDVAIICALRLEYNAVELLLDERDAKPRVGRLGEYTTLYTAGKMGDHAVILVRLTEMGKVSAAVAAERLCLEFPSLSLVLLTGICGGVPQLKDGTDILLGDVAISTSVVQYDFGRLYDDGFKIKDHNGTRHKTPHKNVKNILAILETRRERYELQKQAAIFLERIQKDDLVVREDHEGRYNYPGATQDRLFEANYRHKHRGADHNCRECTVWVEDSDPVCKRSLRSSCEELECDERHLQWRERVEKKKDFEKDGNVCEAQKPSIFFG